MFWDSIGCFLFEIIKKWSKIPLIKNILNLKKYKTQDAMSQGLIS